MKKFFISPGLFFWLLNVKLQLTNESDNDANHNNDDNNDSNNDDNNDEDNDNDEDRRVSSSHQTTNGSRPNKMLSFTYFCPLRRISCLLH